MTKMSTEVSVVLSLLFPHNDVALGCWANMGGGAARGFMNGEGPEV